MRRDVVWQDAALVESFVQRTRGGVPYGADQLAVLVRVARAGARPVRRLLDVGCGSGVVALTLLEAFPGAQAVLVDFSEPMLAAALEATAGIVPAPLIAAGDLAAPAWSEAIANHAPFDLVASCYAIHHLDDARKRALYAEIHGLLAPGGWFVNVEHVASRSAWGEQLSDELMVDAQHAWRVGQGEAVSRAEVAERHATRADKAANILAPVEDQCAWLRAIGYADVDCFFKVFEMAVFGGRRL